MSLTLFWKMKILKIILLFSILFLVGCSTISLDDRLGNEKNQENIDEVFNGCPPQGTEILRKHLKNSFSEGLNNNKDKDGRDGSYNASTVAKEFLLFAVAAENAYLEKYYPVTSKGEITRRGRRNNFYVEAYDPNWIFQDRVILGAGLALDYYFNNHDANVFQIMVAFRGTEVVWNDWNDWLLGNASSITQWLPVQNQYQLARKQFNLIRKIAKIHNKALNNAQEKPMYYYVTGHSLGGGLAQHIAEAFPCVSAIVFNSSPVTLSYRLNPRIRRGYIIDIVENHDLLRLVSLIFRPVDRLAGALLQELKDIDDLLLPKSLGFPFDDSDTHKSYYKFSDLNISELPDGEDHFLTPLSVGMSRMVADDCVQYKNNNKCEDMVADDCVQHKNNNKCEDDVLARKALQLYCNSGFAIDKKDKNGNFVDEVCPPPYRHRPN